MKSQAYFPRKSRGYNLSRQHLTLNAPIATKVVCFSCLLKCLRSLFGKQCGPRSDCSYRSSLFWVHTVCFYTQFVRNVRQLFAADNFSRRHFQMHFFLGTLRAKVRLLYFRYYTPQTKLMQTFKFCIFLLKNYDTPKNTLSKGSGCSKEILLEGK